MYLAEIEPDEIKSQIKKLNSKKASDTFGISAKFLKLAGDKIIRPLTFFINESITIGIAPEKLKLAVVSIQQYTIISISVKYILCSFGFLRYIVLIYGICFTNFLS